MERGLEGVCLPQSPAKSCNVRPVKPGLCLGLRQEMDCLAPEND